MKNNNILIASIVIALGLSIYNTISIYSLKSEDSINEKSNDKTYINPAPNSKNELVPAHKNMMDNPLTPQMNNKKDGPTTAIQFNKDVHDFGNVNIDTENKYSFVFTNFGSLVGVGGDGCALDAFVDY